MWGSPQIVTSKNRWLVNVSNDELGMVQSWFARDDLEHFFKLLKFDEFVDQRRLDFWLDYVDQITFTKMVLGKYALFNNSTDFKDFKQKNMGRWSELLSAAPSNNAFVMRIKDYWFVEFSEIGNACYVYEDNKLPFDVLDKSLDLKIELKDQYKALDRISHSGSWEEKATDYLRRLRILKNIG